MPVGSQQGGEKGSRKSGVREKQGRNRLYSPRSITTVVRLKLQGQRTSVWQSVRKAKVGKKRKPIAEGVGLLAPSANSAFPVSVSELRPRPRACICCSRYRSCPTYFVTRVSEMCGSPNPDEGVFLVEGEKRHRLTCEALKLMGRQCVLLRTSVWSNFPSPVVS